jgi:hypothetical protein
MKRGTIKSLFFIANMVNQLYNVSSFSKKQLLTNYYCDNSEKERASRRPALFLFL